jgi:hypothetical protein
MEKLVDIFQRYDTPASQLQKDTQRAAKQAGWIPPWAREEEKLKKKAAGERSGAIRDKRAKLRRRIVAVAHLELEPAYRCQPFSARSICILRDEYFNIVGCESKNLLEVACLRLARDPNLQSSEILFEMFRFYTSLLIAVEQLPPNDREALESVSDGTLIKDLKLLGVRSTSKNQTI